MSQNRTIDEIIADVREILQDEVSPYRYTDASLVRNLNNALAQLYRVRADAFFGTYDSGIPKFSEADLGQSPGTAFPVHDMYSVSVVYFMAGYAELRDDEFNVDARAATLLKQFVAEIRGAA